VTTFSRHPLIAACAGNIYRYEISTGKAISDDYRYPERFNAEAVVASLLQVIEPFLLQQGLIQRTPRGRMLAAKAWMHLGLDAPKPMVRNDLFESKK